MDTETTTDPVWNYDGGVWNGRILFWCVPTWRRWKKYMTKRAAGRNPTMSSSEEARINVARSSAPWNDDNLENSDKNNYKYSPPLRLPS